MPSSLHVRTIARAALPAFVLFAALAAAQNPPASSRLAGSALLPAAQAPSSAPREKAAEKLREGTRLVDEVGGFSRVAERISFSPGGKGDALRCLENLALERISRAIDESQGQRQWVVSGVITEFKGTNYLLVTKAVIQLKEGETAGGP